MRYFIKDDEYLVEQLSAFHALNKHESANNFHDALEQRLGSGYAKNEWHKLSKRDF